MIDAIDELRVRAEILHKRIQAGDASALERVRAAARRRGKRAAAASPDTEIRRRDCLNVIAAELGFPSWPQAKAALTGEEGASEFGDILCPRCASAHLNLWFKTYDEAAAARSENSGFLLAFRHQFLVVDRYYIAETLRLDPDDPDWKAIGYDWARPAEMSARTRLYAKLIAQLPRESA